jgi:uncharacterized protein DUF6950
MTKLTRYPDWPARLESYIQGLKGREFSYGSFDCALFVCDAIEVMTGVNPAAEFKGRYSTRDEARKLLGAVGGYEGVAAASGLAVIAPKLARRGDVLRMRVFSLGLVSLNGRDAWVLGENGIELFPAAAAVGAWRV